MRVEVAKQDREFRYRIIADPDDSTVGRVEFGDRKNPTVELAELEYRVELPAGAIDPHPDLHAAAIFSVLRPYVTHRLVLPFAVSKPFASSMRQRTGVEIPLVDQRVEPRSAAANGEAGLLYSGGMDSACASLVLPSDMVHLVLARIPRPDILAAAGARATSEQVDLLAVCDDTSALGRRLAIVRDDHEGLTRPYPTWHSNITLLPVLYLADTYRLSVVETGDVLNAFAFSGYHAGFTTWTFSVNSAVFSAEGLNDTRPQASQAQPGLFETMFGNSALGLGFGRSIMGLTEVGTAIVVSRSPLRGKTFSCYRPVAPGSKDRYCLQCDKCFRKLLLSHVVEDREVPAVLFEQFLSQPHLAPIFSRPILDWHDVWYYLFQKMRCDHPFVHRMQIEARKGPDMSWMERWYSPAGNLISPVYRESVVRAILERVEPMTTGEIAALEHFDVPPLPVMEAGPGRVAVTTGETTGSVPPIPSPAMAVRRGVVISIEEQGGERAFRFQIGPVREDAKVYIRGTHLGLTYQPCTIDHAFHVVVASLYRVMRTVEARPVETADEEWKRLVDGALERARTSCQYLVSVSPWT